MATETILRVQPPRHRAQHARTGEDDVLGLLESAVGPCALVLSLWATAFFVDGELSPSYLILAVVVFALSFPGRTHLRSSAGHMLLKISLNWAWIAGLLLLTGFATGYVRDFTRQALITWLWAAPLTEFCAYLVLRATAPWLFALQGPRQRAVIVGMNEHGMALAERIRKSIYSRIHVLGFIDSREPSRLPHMSGSSELLAGLDELADFIRRHRVQQVYLSLPMAAQPRILDLLDGLKDTTATIYFLPDMLLTDLIQGHAGSICGMPLISVCDTPFRGADGVVKRASDILLSLLILALVAPLMLLLAVAVKLGSKGPVIFKQRRYGLDGKEILVYKFRSMKVTEDGSEIPQAVKGDPRVTALGAVMRRTSMDELPQFINVLQGRMSVVGPRPHAVAHNELYRKLIKGYMVRHKVRPGITGWAQVNGFRGETNTLDKMRGRIELDLDYLRNWSLQLDLRIIARTIRQVVKDGNAH